MRSHNEVGRIVRCAGARDENYALTCLSCPIVRFERMFCSFPRLCSSEGSEEIVQTPDPNGSCPRSTSAAGKAQRISAGIFADREGIKDEKLGRQKQHRS